MRLSGQHPTTNLTARVILVLTVCSASLPFVNQAFHIDDRIYLEVADHILEQPLFPYDYPPVFEGLHTPDAASHSHLPLTSYYLALFKLLTSSQQEWVYHLAFLLFPILAALAFYDLASRYVNHSLAATVLLVFSPGFLVLSHTLMTEVPLLALWLVSLAQFMRIVAGEAKNRHWVYCALGLTGASFVSLTSAGLILLMGAYLLAQRMELGKRKDGPPIGWVVCLLALPLLLWFLWYLRAYLHYDRWVVFNTLLHVSKRGGLSWELVGTKALSFVLTLGATVFFPAVVWYGFARTISLRVFILVFFLSLAPFYLWIGDWNWLHMVLFGFFFSSGLLVLWKAMTCGHTILMSWLSAAVLHGFRNLSVSWGELRPVSESPDGETAKSGDLARQSLLLLWFLGILFSCLLIYYSGSVRYMLLAVPPVLLWWVISLEGRVQNTYLLRNLIWMGVILTGIYSGLVAYTDYRFAEVYRREARQILSEYSEPNRTIWYAGEWGFRYYLEQGGARILSRTQSEPKPGDIIVKPYVASPWVTLYDGDEQVDLLEQRQASLNLPIRLLDFSSQAGFYSTGWGILPISWAVDEKWEWFNVFRVKKQYEGPIPEPETHF